MSPGQEAIIPVLELKTMSNFFVENAQAILVNETSEDDVHPEPGNLQSDYELEGIRIWIKTNISQPCN